MSSLIIVKPIQPTAIASNTPNVARLFTPDPKEAVPYTGGAGVNMDFGAPVTLDSAFVGYHTALADQQWSVTATDASYTPTTPLFYGTLAPLGYGPPYHSFARVAAPVTSRYWQFNVNTGSSNTPFLIGVFALGLAFQTTWGTEWGAGRPIEDTGAVERLFGGGFGIDDGVAAGGYQWTFGDLQADERRRLYQLVKDRRTTRSVLVVEDADQTDGLNERIHWGLFTKLEPYERLDPLNTKWGLQIQDWA